MITNRNRFPRLVAVRLQAYLYFLVASACRPTGQSPWVAFRPFEPKLGYNTCSHLTMMRGCDQSSDMIYLYYSLYLGVFIRDDTKL